MATVARSSEYERDVDAALGSAAVRWTVRTGDGPTVGDVLRLAGADALAVEEGRVFVGRHRVKRLDEPVGPGDVVDVAAPRTVVTDAASVKVLFRTEDLVAVDKPAGIPTIADHGGAAHALVARAARVLGVAAAALHPTSRLDRDVSGVVVFALNARAARRLTEARTRGVYSRRYVAVAARAPATAAGVWDAPVGRAADPRHRAVRGREAVPAITRFVTVARASGGQALLAVAPVTGRTHQIRVHAAHAGAPLVGDKTYGGPTRLTLDSGRVFEPRRIALHAGRVEVPGSRGETLIALAPVPDALASLWSSLGGSRADWEKALSCAV
jgi:23S rRNA pseudouridine1911/1915/1917 synthase